MTVLVIAAVGVTAAGAFQGPFSGSVLQNSDGTFTIDPRDQNDALKAGYIPVRRSSHEFAPMVSAPATAAVGAIVASVALSNTSLTIAANPDTMRQVKVRVDPGTLPITAGVLTVTYAANDGTAAQVDVLSLVTAASTLLTLFLTKGALTVASAVVTGLVGGASPKIQLDTTAVIAVPVPPQAVDVTILKEVTAGADTSANLGTITNAGLWTPHSAPNASATYAVAYSSIAP